jgi:hypothetical protein
MAKKETGPAVLPEDDPRRLIIFVSLLELDREARLAALGRAAEIIAAGQTPLFITDDPDFSIFATRGLLYEYLPPPAEQKRHGAAMKWDHHLVMKLRLLMEKWRPVRVESVGTPLEAFIAKAKPAATAR